MCLGSYCLYPSFPPSSMKSLGKSQRGPRCSPRASTFPDRHPDTHPQEVEKIHPTCYECVGSDPQNCQFVDPQLHLGKKVDNIKKDFFRAGDHGWDFIVLIPKVRPAVYSTQEDVTFQVDEPSPSSSSSSSSSSSIDDVDDLVNWNPRVPASTSTTPITSPISSPTPTPLRKRRAFIHLSSFSESVSAARAISNIRLLNACWDGVVTGQFDAFIENPSSHLAFPRPDTSTHRVLQPYDESFYPGCLQRTFQELQFLHTDLGRALRALNSTVGISSDILQEIIRDCTDYTVCKCQFTLDGFHRHIRGGFCGNCPTPTAVTQEPTVERLPHEFAVRELPPRKQLGTEAEFLESPIGAALLEWNPPLRVPVDVWATASTATTECDTCKLSRTFPAHAAHLHPVTGMCNDLVDEGAGSDKT
ncbi:hypothetical protein B0H13DRAFT_1897852 [Mycena leptocephala]|nr:hypothetical protein B0H13DRAFT_1897852 [Mycena leptocephala]